MFGPKNNAEIKQLVGKFSDADVYLGKKRIPEEAFDEMNERGELDIVFNGQTHRFIDPEKAQFSDRSLQLMADDPCIHVFDGDLTGVRINITKKGIAAGGVDNPELG